MFAVEFLINDESIDQVNLDGLSLEQLSRNHYVPVEIMKFKFNNA